MTLLKFHFRNFSVFTADGASWRETMSDECCDIPDACQQHLLTWLYIADSRHLRPPSTCKHRSLSTVRSAASLSCWIFTCAPVYSSVSAMGSAILDMLDQHKVVQTLSGTILLRSMNKQKILSSTIWTEVKITWVHTECATKEI